MLQYDLHVDKRETGSKHHLKELRNNNVIPCVAYGHNEESRSYSVNETEMIKLLHKIGKENAIINLIDGKKKHMTVIKDVQREPKSYKIRHIDFLMLHKGETFKVDVPVLLTGAPEGVKEGGVLEHLIREISVKVLPSKIPEHFEVEISSLNIGDSLHVKDLKFTDGEILDDPDETICIIAAPKTVAAEEESEIEETAAEPELIGETKEEETAEK